MSALYGGDNEGKTRVSLLDIYPRGTDAAGNGNDQIGSGGKVPLVIKVPTTQTKNAIELQLANKTITAAGGNPVLWSVDQAGNVTISGVTNNSERVVQVALTAAQIIAMFTTPVPIIPAPAAGQCIIVNQILVELDLTATAFTGGGVVHFYYHGLTVEIMAQTLAAATIQGGAARTLWLLQPVQTAGGSVVTTDVGIDITNATQVFAAGTGTMKVTVWYNLLTEG